MITIADRVRDWINLHPAYAKHMREGLLNYSALARQIKPELERASGERFSIEAVTLALNRAAKQDNQASYLDYSQFIGEVSVQSGLAALTIPQADIDTETFFEAAKRLHMRHEYTLYTRGIWHTSLIGSAAVVRELQDTLDGTIISQDLVGITVKLRPGHLPVPGVCAHVLQLLAAHDINLIEVTSSHNELTVFIPEHSTQAALACLLQK